MSEPELGGSIVEEGEPFKTKRAARASARKAIATQTSWLASKLVRIQVEGTRPAFEIPAGLPSLGQVIYILDEETSEVLEVTVGAVGFNGFGCEAGYDPSPGNCEVSMIRISEWWESRETAHNAAWRKHFRAFAFVPKKEVARRADELIEKIWSKAAARMRDPEWNRQYNESVRSLEQAPIAAG